MKQFKIIKRKFKIDNVSELSKGCKTSKIISCTVEDLDNGTMLKIKAETASGLSKIIINKIDDFDLECGDIITIKNTSVYQDYKAQQRIFKQINN